ncbi:FMN-binding protein [Streptomyces sp. NPDC004647]|uniref:FMN-binding protein n=1 Tax=Streptomyces sp. NPDC004647 TaxID=3154671 RepID=UPI0033B0131B
MKQHPIRRILLTTAATVSGVVLLLALKSPGLPGTSTEAGAPVAGVTAPATGAPGSVPSRSAGSDPAAPDPQLPEQPQDPGQQGEQEQRPEPSQGGGAAPRTVTGSAVETDYGVVQVKITMSGDRLTAATAVRSPSSTPRSKEITSSAVPRLDQAAVAAQSAEIDAVSGASYTSQGYVASLQSALDKAGV